MPCPFPSCCNRRGTITFKIKPHTCQRCLEGTNKTLWSPGPSERCSDLPRGQGLWLQQFWEVQQVEAIVLLEEDLHHRPARWAIQNWRTIIPKKFSHSCQSSRPHNRLSNLGIWQNNRITRESDSEGQWDFNTELPQDWGKQRLLEDANKIYSKEKGAGTFYEPNPCIFS